MCENEPEVMVIPSGETARDVYGHRYGSELLKFNRSHLDALLNGHQLAIEIRLGEYVLFIEVEEDGLDRPLWTNVRYWDGRIPPPEYFADTRKAWHLHNGPAINYRELVSYARQAGRELADLSREEIQGFAGKISKGEVEEMLKKPK